MSPKAASCSWTSTFDTQLYAQRTRHEIFRRVHGRLFGRKKAAIDQFLNQRVVARHAFELIVAETIHSGIANVRYADFIVPVKDHCHRGSHSLAFWNFLRRSIDDLVGVSDRIAEHHRRFA